MARIPSKPLNWSALGPCVADEEKPACCWSPCGGPMAPRKATREAKWDAAFSSARAEQSEPQHCRVQWCEVRDGWWTVSRRLRRGCRTWPLRCDSETSRWIARAYLLDRKSSRSDGLTNWAGGRSPSSKPPRTSCEEPAGFADGSGKGQSQPVYREPEGCHPSGGGTSRRQLVLRLSLMWSHGSSFWPVARRSNCA